MLAAVAWLLWVLVVLAGALVGLAAVGTLAALVVGIPAGASIRLRRGEWPAWYAPMLRY